VGGWGEDGVNCRGSWFVDPIPLLTSPLKGEELFFASCISETLHASRPHLCDHPPPLDDPYELPRPHEPEPPLVPKLTIVVRAITTAA